MKNRKSHVALAATLVLTVFALPGMANADAYPEGVTDKDLATADAPPADWPATIHDNPVTYALMAEQLEIRNPGDLNTFKWDVQGWGGTDLDKLWFKTEGERTDAKYDGVRAELLYSRAVADYWDLQAGVRTDLASNTASRSWAAFGVQGLAPNFFEVQATAYASDNAHYALRGEVSYDIMFTQRLVLTPRVDAMFYSKDDPKRELGAGLSSAEAGARLRYEIRRELAPYIGVNWERKFGSTASMARAGGGDVELTTFVVGLRLWF